MKISINSLIKKINHKKLTISMMSVGLLTLSFGFFGPLQMYIHNAETFWFPLTSVIQLAIIFTLLVFSACTILLYFIPNQIFSYCSAAFFGLGLAVYLQGNWLPYDYGILDGHEPEWSLLTMRAILNSIIWIVCILFPVFFVKIQFAASQKLITYVSAFIIIVQTVTVTILLITNQNSFDETIFTTTTKDRFVLSPERNVVVFIVDNFDAQIMNDILEQHPQYHDYFADFTYYSNTLAMFPRTLTSIPYLLTGSKFLNNITPFYYYIREAYQDAPMFEILHKNQFSIGLYGGYSRMISGDIIEKIDNAIEKKPEISSFFEFGKMFYQFTSIRYAPHILKQHFWLYSAEFDDLRYFPRLQYSAVNHWHDEFIFDLKNEGITANNEKKAFRLYHLFGSHPPFFFDEKAQRIEVGSGNIIDQTRGALYIIFEYLNQLKENNIYDDTMVVITADHGHYNLGQHISLIVKNWDERKPFTISDAPISFSDIMPTILNAISGAVLFENDFRTIRENDTRERLFFHYVCDGILRDGFFLEMREYVWRGHASDINAGHFTGRVFSPSNIALPDATQLRTYILGDVISFTDDDVLSNYVLYGIFSDFWSVGSYSELVMKIEDPPHSDLTLILGFNVFPGINGNQRVRLYVNDTFVGESIYYVDDFYGRFNIPNLLIAYGEIRLRFEFPDAISPFALHGIDDARSKALRFRAISIDYYNSNFINIFAEQTITSENPNIIIDFSEGGNNSLFVTHGWHVQEPIHRWTSELSALEFFTDNSYDIQMEISGTSFEPSGSTNILLNGHHVETIRMLDANKISILFPQHLLSSYGRQVITFESLEAVSPRQAGGDIGDRILGISVFSIELSKS